MKDKTSINPKSGLTEKEQEIAELLIKAHNLFTGLNRDHPSEMINWVNGIHILQSTLGARTLRRDYPEFYYKDIL